MSKPTEKQFTGKVTYTVGGNPDDRRALATTVGYSLADGKITGKVTLEGGATSSFEVPTRNKTLPQDWKLLSAAREHVEALLKTGQHKPLGSVSVDLS